MPSARSWLLPFTRPPTNTDLKNPRVNVVLDRDRAAALNLNWNSVATTLYDAFGPQLASTIYSQTNQYRVLLEMLPGYQRFTDGLKMIYLKSNTGELVPLNAVAKLVEDAGPQTIPHSGQLPSVTLSFRSEERRVGKECRSRWSPY